MKENLNILSGRREFLFLYDIKMGNPNGDPDENRPRVLPDGTHYVTDVRLKRFVRDFVKNKGNDILVDTIEGRTTNLTGRVANYLSKQNIKEASADEIVEILLSSLIDARMFGSSFAFKSENSKSRKGRVEAKVVGSKIEWESPKSLTGAIQMNMGEVLHKAEEVDIHGTSILGSDEDKTTGTFTTYFGLRYALIGFSGIANEHSAKISRLSDDDYELFLKAMWHGVRSAGNTRTKVGQIPHFLISIEYKKDEEFQFGRLHDYLKLQANDEKPEKTWASPMDYKIDLSTLMERIDGQKSRIERIRYDKSSDIQFVGDLPSDWIKLDAENLNNKDSK